MIVELTKEGVRRAAQELAFIIKAHSVGMDVRRPGAGALMIEALADELKATLPKKACSAEGCGVDAGKAVAETAGKCRCDFDFGRAISALKQGKRVARKGWNGKGQFVELATCISYKAPNGEVVNAEHSAIGNAALAFVGTSGVQLGWLASQADMLAEDWYVVE